MKSEKIVSFVGPAHSFSNLIFLRWVSEWARGGHQNRWQEPPSLDLFFHHISMIRFRCLWWEKSFTGECLCFSQDSSKKVTEKKTLTGDELKGHTYKIHVSYQIQRELYASTFFSPDPSKTKTKKTTTMSLRAVAVPILKRSRDDLKKTNQW